MVVVYLLGNDLHIRIFDTRGEKVIDGPASELLSDEALTSLKQQLDPWPLSLLEGEKEDILKNATSIADYAPGTLTFQMQAAGPPSFDWNPTQLGGFSNGDWSQVVDFPPETTNWLELISQLMNSYPGMDNTTSSHVLIDVSPFPTLHRSVEIDSLIVRAGRELDIMPGTMPGQERAPVLTVGGGLVGNSGTINVIGNLDGSSLKLDSPDAVLCGSGTVHLINEANLQGSTGAEPFTFCNYNTISGTGNAMDQYFDSANSTINNVGTFRAEGGGGFLATSANHILNQGVFQSLADTDCSIYGDRLDSRVGSRIAAEGLDSQTVLQFDEAEHAGLIRASDGGFVSVAPWNFARATWNAGQSFTNDVGFFRAEGIGSELQLQDIDMKGGCFVLGSGGAMEAFDTDFTGSVFQVGDFNESLVDNMSGFLTLNGVDRVFTKVCLTNYGTVSVPGQVEFVDNLIFANNGTVNVPAGGLLRIRAKTIETPGASDEALSQPGAANATGATLAGGTWDITGTLLIDGASFTGIGANTARASTGSGSIDDLGGAERVVREDPEDDLSRVLSLGKPANVTLRGSDWSFPALTSLKENRGSLCLDEGAVFPGGALGSNTLGNFTNKGELLIKASSKLTVGGSFTQTGAHAKTELGSSGALASTTTNFQILGGTGDSGPGLGYFQSIRQHHPLWNNDSRGIPFDRYEHDRRGWRTGVRAGTRHRRYR